MGPETGQTHVYAGDEPVNQGDPSGLRAVNLGPWKIGCVGFCNPPACRSTGGNSCRVDERGGMILTWDEYNSINAAVTGTGGITAHLLEGNLATIWQESYGNGYANGVQTKINTLTTYGLPDTSAGNDCSATPTSDELSGFRCFEYAILGVYDANSNSGHLPTTDAVEETEQDQVYPVEYLFFLQEEKGVSGLLAAAELAYAHGDILESLLELLPELTAYGGKGCRSLASPKVVAI